VARVQAMAGNLSVTDHYWEAMMKHTARMRPVLSLLVATAALFGLMVAAAPAEAAAGDQSINVAFTGGLNYANSGTSTSGQISVTRSASTITGVLGTATIPGQNGGDATVSFNISGLFGFPIYLGAINVSDPSAAFSQSTFVLFSPVTSNGTGAKGSASWISFKDLNFGTYRLSWSVADLKTQKAGVRFKSFANTGSNEIYIGTGDLGVAANRAERGVTWTKPGSYDFSFTYDPQALTLTTNVSGGVGSLTRNLSGPLTNLDSIALHVVDRDVGQVDLLNAIIDGAPLGSFVGNGAWATYAFPSNSLNDGFVFTGTLVIDGAFSNSSELSKLEIGVGTGLHT
jgi:hypothetical protein